MISSLKIDKYDVSCVSLVIPAICAMNNGSSPHIQGITKANTQLSLGPSFLSH